MPEVSVKYLFDKANYDFRRVASLASLPIPALLLGVRNVRWIQSSHFAIKWGGRFFMLSQITCPAT